MAEKEYIEREAVYNFCKDQLEEETGAYSKGRNAGLRVAMSAAMNKDAIPAADVRHVVLCRDCQHWDTEWVPSYAKANEHFCPIVTLTTRDDWFCADGEKREES